MGDLRESKKRETRQRISDVATALFFERGFDGVTIEEIAVAAKVSKMTVTNYFARKEELLLDREDDLKLVPFRTALRDRPEHQSPVDALRALVQRLGEEKNPLVRIDRQSLAWWRIIDASPALRARLRELADEAADGLAIELGGPKPDGRARLLGGMIVWTVRTARQEAIRQLERGASAKKANAALLDVLELGFTALEALAKKST